MKGLSVRAMCSFSSIGVRPVQEDHLIAIQEKGIWVVADGFGGPNAGPVVAQAACDAVQGFLYKEAGDLDATLPFVLRNYYSLAGNVLFNALIHANRKTMEINREKKLNEQGGASVLAAFLDQNLLALANVGCCTAWLFRGGQFIELVTPRSYARLVDPLAPSPRESLQLPLCALGMTEELEPEIWEYRIQEGDWVVLCTDGLSPEARQGIFEIHKRKLEPRAGTEETLEFLQKASFLDNAAVTVVVF